MSLFIIIDGVDQAASVRLTQGFTTASAAELGAVSVATIQVDDPTSSIDILGWRSAYIFETDANPTRLWTGFIAARSVTRGPFRTGSGRVWNCEAVDLNWNLTRRSIRSADGKRPAETDLVRVAWLMAHASMSGLVFTSSLTNTSTGGLNLDEADYRHQFPMDVLADIAPQCAKTAFVLWDNTNSRPTLFYDSITAAVNTSTAKISNVFSDLAAGVYQPFEDASLDRTPEDTYSGIDYEFAGGASIYVTNATTASTYAARDFVYSTSRVGKIATATALANAFLTAHSIEADTVHCTIEMPRANVNDILEGQRMQIRFSHLPGLSAYAYARVVRRLVAQREGDDSTYVVQLELTNGVKAGFGAGGTGITPLPSGSVHYYEGTMTGVVSSGPFASDASSAAFPIGSYTWSITVTTANNGFYGSVALTVAENHLVTPIDRFVHDDVTAASPLAPTTTFTGTFVISTDQPTGHMYYSIGGTSGDPYTVAFYVDPVGWVSTLPPATGQPVGPETVTMSGVSGTTAFPFADGSLQVFVDNVDQTAAIATQNGATGAFTLLFIPTTTEVVRVYYQGR